MRIKAVGPDPLLISPINPLDYKYVDGDMVIVKDW